MTRVTSHVRPAEVARWMAEAKKVGTVKPAVPSHSFTLLFGNFPNLQAPTQDTVEGAALMVANQQPHRALITVNFDGAHLTKIVSLEGVCI